MSALSDLINAALTRRGWAGKSLRDLAAETNEVVSKDAWRGIKSGAHGTPREPTLEAISAALDITMSDLRRAAGVPVGAEGPYAGPPESARMSLRQRLALDELIRSIVTATGDADEEAPKQEQGEGGTEGSSSRQSGRGRRAPTTTPAEVLTQQQPATRGDADIYERDLNAMKDRVEEIEGEQR